MSVFMDLTNQTFGRLTVIERAENGKSGQARWSCTCECGNTTIVQACHLRSGHTTSCSCVHKEGRIERGKAMAMGNILHGVAKHPLYQVWRMMVQRCTNPAHQAYKNYGGRGITVCDEWLTDCAAYISWIEENLGDKPTPQHTIDRRDNARGYEPGNLQWASKSEQIRNQRNPWITRRANEAARSLAGAA